jgi:hypothetical protein
MPGCLSFSRSKAQEFIANVKEFIGIKTSLESSRASQIKHDQIITSQRQSLNNPDRSVL